MIVFVSGPHGQVIDDAERKYITSLLKSCYDFNSQSFRVNILYNNYMHFQNPNISYDAKAFLKELVSVVHSPYYRVEVMGGIHSDPYGHTSSYASALAQDNYIRFKVSLGQNCTECSNLKVLHPMNIYHFLINVTWWNMLL